MNPASPSPLAPVEGKYVLPMRIINFILMLGMFTMNILATTLPINNNTTGAISDKYFTFITPAGYAFSIWGLIYFFIACFGIYQLLPRSYDSRPINEGIGYLFALNALANGAWIVVWHYELMYLSIMIMFCLFTTLSIIYYRLSQHFNPASTWSQWVLIDLGFSLYYAWIICATILNIYSISTNTEDTKFISAGVVGLIIALLLSGSIAIYRLDPVISGVGCWATTAIAINHKETSQIFLTAVVVASILGGVSVLILGWNAVQIWLTKKRVGWTESADVQRHGSLENELLSGGDLK